MNPALDSSLTAPPQSAADLELVSSAKPRSPACICSPPKYFKVQDISVVRYSTFRSSCASRVKVTTGLTGASYGSCAATGSWEKLGNEIGADRTLELCYKSFFHEPLPAV